MTKLVDSPAEPLSMPKISGILSCGNHTRFTAKTVILGQGFALAHDVGNAY